METADEVAPESGSQADVLQMEDYLKKVCPVLLDADNAAFESSLKATDATQKLKKFISDIKSPILLVQKRVSDDEAAPGTLHKLLAFFAYAQQEAVISSFLILRSMHWIKQYLLLS